MRKRLVTELLSDIILFRLFFRGKRTTNPKISRVFLSTPFCRLILVPEGSNLLLHHNFPLPSMHSLVTTTQTFFPPGRGQETRVGPDLRHLPLFSRFRSDTNTPSFLHLQSQNKGSTSESLTPFASLLYWDLIEYLRSDTVLVF